jgi:hypothetical protein
VKSSRIQNILAIAVFCLGIIGSSQSIVSAASAKAQPVPANNNTNSLKISPLRSDLSIVAGSSGTSSVTVYNTTNTSVVLKSIENDFVAGDEKGTPSVILDENSYAPTHSLKRFMIPLPNVTVPANSSTTVTVHIVVPKTAQAGGYFGALRFAPASPDGGSTVNIGASVVSLILMTVPGPTTEQLNVTNFDVQQNGGTATNFRTPNDLSLMLRFQNKGNIQEAPFGQVNVQKGGKVIYSYNFNTSDPKATVLPDSARRWTVPLKNIGKFGKYSISATFGYGSNGQSLSVTKSIWIIPSTYIIGGLIGLVVLIGIIIAVTLSLKSYKRRILRNSRNRF